MYSLRSVTRTRRQALERHGFFLGRINSRAFHAPPCITGPFNTVAHLTSTSRPDPHHSHTSLLLTTLNHLTATQYPGPSYFTQNHDPPHLHSTPRPTSLSLNTQTLLTSTHQPDPSHFSTQRHEFPPTEHMKTLNFNCIELG